MSANDTATVHRLRHGVAEEVRVLLARRRLSATELARQLGWSQPYISRRMIGDQPFDLDDLEAIAGALGVDVADLLPPRDGATKRSGAPTDPAPGHVRLPELERRLTTPIPRQPSDRPWPSRPATPAAPTGPRRTAPTGRVDGVSRL